MTDVEYEKHVAINSLLYGEVKGFQMVYEFSSTLRAIDYLANLGFIRLAGFITKQKSNYEQNLIDTIKSEFPNLTDVKRVNINIGQSTIRIYKPSYKNLINSATILGGLQDYSFSRIFNYLVYMGLDFFVINGWFVPSTHINFDVDLKTKIATWL